jgi:hypothetical protein
MDDGQEEIKAQVGSLAFRIDPNQEEMEAMLYACLGKTEAYPEMTEANPEETESAAEHPEVPKEDATVETLGTLN